jgi:hypothetical protein
MINCAYLAIGWAVMYSTADLTEVILSASESGISMENSSSKAITTSQASRESRSRSLKVELGVTAEAFT